MQRALLCELLGTFSRQKFTRLMLYTFLWNYSVISCVAVAVTLLLLSILDIWKLELGLAPYSITAAIGALTLELVINKSWVTQRSMPEDKSCKKLERQLHLGEFQRRQRSNDIGRYIFSLPQNLRVMVSNCQPLQTIFAVSEGEFHTQQMKTDEKFSPIVTIVDAATQQTLDCVLLLYGEKPPVIKCRTLFCYIQVSCCDKHHFYHHPPYHMESKPCKQGELQLTFCFHQPGTVCVIQLSLHSIADSEGVEYMYNCEDCTCVVQILNRDQHGVVKIRDRHGVVRMKEPPLLRYTGPLATVKYHKLGRVFTRLYLSPDHEQIQQLSKRILYDSSISLDIKVFALCWKALSVALHKNYKHAEQLLTTALKKASKLECQNSLLLQGRVVTHLAFMQYAQRNDDKALEYISGAKERLLNATPSNETAFAVHTELLVKSRRLYSTPRSFSSELFMSAERDYELLLEHAKHMKEYERPAICSFHAVKASFHLRSSQITDKLPPKEYWPSTDDLRKAEECLSRVSLDTMPDQSNFYTAQYYRTCCDLHIWKQQYHTAMHYLEKTRNLYVHNKLYARMQYVEQRFELLETLKVDDKNLKEYYVERDDKIIEILKEFS